MVQGMEGGGYLELIVEGEDVYLVSNFCASVSDLIPDTDAHARARI
jgi:hypothetical protein